MLGCTPGPASRITTLIPFGLNSLAINAPAKPDPTIATSHLMQLLSAMAGSLQGSVCVMNPRSDLAF
jgi:hypothetical protein